MEVATVTTHACSAFLGVNGLTLLMAQDRIMGDLHKIDQRNDPVESRQMCRSIIDTNGAISLGQAFLLYSLATRKEESKSRLIALSMLPRLGVYLFKGMRFWGSCTLAMILGLLFWATNSHILKIGSALLLLQSIYLFLFGNKAALCLFQIDIERSDCKKPRAFMRFMANEHLASATFVTLLALESDVYWAAGMTTLLWAILMLEMGFVSRTWKLVDAQSPISQVAHAALSLVFATGFLWPFG